MSDERMSQEEFDRLIAGEPTPDLEKADVISHGLAETLWLLAMGFLLGVPVGALAALFGPWALARG